MSDDLDDLLRRAMKTLDDQVPSGYFEGLPNRTLARLEDSSMQTTGTSGNANESTATGVPPQPRDEDSGLHDIRSMASSTKMRLTSRRSSTMPPVDEDILASSSAGWKAVALPEPAKMVSLPELSELPSADEVKKAERTSARKVAKAAVAIESTPIATGSVAAPVPTPQVATAPAATSVAPAAVTPIIGARLAQQKSQGAKTGLYAAIGLGLAAAAGVAFFVMTKNDKQAAPQQVAVATQEAPAPSAVTATRLEPAPAPVAAAPAADPAPEAVAIASGAAAEPADEEQVKAPAKADRKRAAKDVDKNDGKASKGTKDETAKPVEVKASGGAGGGEESGEPSFDQLLKEAGVQDKKPDAPKLAKKSLSGGDIKTGMSSVAGKAQACYAGTEGTAKVKLTVAPTGEVQKVTVTGPFAGTPVASCVEAAVKSATFPPWDGGPQTFGYSYLLAE